MEELKMRKLVALLLVLVFVLAIGCAGKPAAKPTGAPAAPVSTANAVSDVDADIAEIDSIDQELSNTDLDSLDAELDIQI